MEYLFYFKKSFRSCPNVSHFAPAIHSAPDVLPPCPPFTSFRAGYKGGQKHGKKAGSGGLEGRKSEQRAKPGSCKRNNQIVIYLLTNDPRCLI